jgi:hypothetical protein
MLISPTTMATMAPASPLPVPKPPAELAECSKPTTTLISPATPAAMATRRPLPLLVPIRPPERARASPPKTTPISPTTAATPGTFALPFDEIGSIVGRSPAAAKQLASRARRRVRGSPAASDAGRARQREVVEAFLRAARAGDLEGLLAVLDPDAVVRIDAAARFDGVVRIDAPAADAGMAREVRGASTWAKQFIALSRGLRFVQPALINGSVGLILAPRGNLSRALTFTFTNAKVTQVEVIGDPARLRELDIAVL